MSILIEYPLLALVPAASFLLMFARSKRRLVLAAAIGWLAYLPYEFGMKLRVLCSGECNIRIDLLLLYPVLIAMSAIALYAFIVSLRAASKA